MCSRPKKPQRMPKPSDALTSGSNVSDESFKRELLEGLAELLVVLGHERKQAGEYSGLDLLEPRQRRDVRHAGVDDRVADGSGVDLAHGRDQEAYLAGLELLALGRARRKYAHLLDRVLALRRVHDDACVLANHAVHHAHERDDARVAVEPRVDDQRLQRRIDAALRRRNPLDDALEQLVDAEARLGADAARRPWPRCR